MSQQPADPFGDVAPHVAAARVAHRSPRQRDPGHEHGGQQHRHDLSAEREGASRGEQRRADRRPGELVERDEPGLQPSLRDTEVALVHEHRHQGAGGGVDEHLRGANQEERPEHHCDADDAGDDRGSQRDQHERPQQVRDHHQAQPVDAVGDRAGVQAEEQPGQLL